jgi:hypothetical protein
MAYGTLSRSALRQDMTTTASADFSLRLTPSPFQAQGEISPGKDALLLCTTAGFTPPRLDHKSFAVSCPLALLGSAFYPVLIHRLADYAPRFLPTLGHPHAVALHFVRCDQLTAGLAPTGVRPCWAHKKRPPEGGRENQRNETNQTAVAGRMKEMGAVPASSKVTSSQASLLASIERSSLLFRACPDLKPRNSPTRLLPSR